MRRNGQLIHEKILDMVSHQGNSNQMQEMQIWDIYYIIFGNEMPICTHYNSLKENAR